MSARPSKNNESVVNLLLCLRSSRVAASRSDECLAVVSQGARISNVLLCLLLHQYRSFDFNVGFSVTLLQGLRVHDNPALQEALKGCKNLYPVFVFDPWFAGNGK